MKQGDGEYTKPSGTFWEPVERGLPWLWGILLAFVSLRLLFFHDPLKNNLLLRVYVPAAKAFFSGDAIYAVDGGFRYPPIAALYFGPLAVLPERVASVLWRLLCFAFLYRATLAVLSARSFRGIDARSRVILHLSVLLTALISLNNGQANSIVLGALLLGTRAFDSGKTRSAAAWITLAASLKLYPIVLGLLFCARRPQFLRPLLIGMTLFLLLPFVIAGPDYVSEQYRALFDHLMHDERREALGTAYRDFWLVLESVGLEVRSPLYSGLQVIAGLLAAAWLSVSRGKRSDLSWDALQIATLWMLLFGPATEKASYLLIGPVLAFQWTFAIGRRNRVGLLLASLSTILMIADHLLVPMDRAYLAQHVWLRCLHPYAASLLVPAFFLRARSEATEDLETRSALTPPS